MMDEDKVIMAEEPQAAESFRDKVLLLDPDAEFRSHMRGALESSFKEIEELTKAVHHPEKLIARRIELELSEPEQKYHLFVVR